MYNDGNIGNGYFKKDKEMQWKVNLQNMGCYICDKHRLAMVFIDADGPNKDLVEIKDEKAVLRVAQALNVKESDVAPIICGTLGSRGFSSH